MLAGNTLVATAFHKQMAKGRNGALHLSAEATDGSSVDVVVKLRKRMREGVRALVAEWLSAYIAQQVGLRVPTPYVVKITRSFAEAVSDITAGADIRASIGSAFGSELVAGMQPLSPYATLPESALQTCGNVLGCDNYIINPDRMEGTNPNLALLDGGFVLFDHDLALAWKFALPQLRPESADILGAQKHVLRRWLAGKKDALTGFRTSLSKLDGQRLDEIVETLPGDWREEIGETELKEILRFLKARLEHAETWIKEVETWLTTQSPLMLQ